MSVNYIMTFNTSRKEFSVEIKDEMLCALEKLTEQAGRQFSYSFS